MSKGGFDFGFDFERLMNNGVVTITDEQLSDMGYVGAYFISSRLKNLNISIKSWYCVAARESYYQRIHSSRAWTGR